MTNPDSFFNTVHIQNFKSLKDVTLENCKRINLLIGKPNVGKSNILEAIGLFSLPNIAYNRSRKITQFVRMENLAELFYGGNIDKKVTVNLNGLEQYTIECLEGIYKNHLIIEINANTEKTDDNFLSFIADDTLSVDLIGNYRFSDNEKSEFENIFFRTKNKWFQTTIEKTSDDLPDDVSFISLVREPPFKVSKKAIFLKNSLSSKVRYYKFSHDFSFKKSSTYVHYLIPPTGVNLLEAIQYNKIDRELSKIFSEYNQELLFDKTNNSLRIMRLLRHEYNAMISFPISSIADTLQRVIFFKTAIASNKESILLFEEPEAHCFPPYIKHFTQDVIDSETNQFFIATHSPYVLNDFLEYQRDDVAIFIANFKDGQTVIRRLTDEEINDVYQYGIDLFFNHELFTDD